MKQAIAFVLDASPSMLKPYPRSTGNSSSGDINENKRSRFDCAKQAVESMISELMLQSVTNEVCVVLCKTLETMHHKMADGEDEDNVPFPNLTELTLPQGVTRPTVELLRSLSKVQPTSPELYSSEIQGDIIDGVLLAADALYERTNKRKYERQIVVLTDAEHDIVMDVSQILVVIDSLRSMECKLIVIGLDFDTAGVYDEPASAPNPPKKELYNNAKKIKLEVEEDADRNASGNLSSKCNTDDEDEHASNQEGDDDGNIIRYRSKADRERLLLSLTEKTGGEVIAATTLHEVLFARKGKRLQTATRRKFVLVVAPGLQVDARYVLLMKKTPQETLKTEAVLIDNETNVPIIDPSTGLEVTDQVASITQYVDAVKNPDSAVAPESITTAIRYGSDLIPMSSFDFDGLSSVYMTNYHSIRDDDQDFPSNEPRMEILGYIERKKIPNVYLQGPPYTVSGNDSQRTASIISAMAQALQRLDKVAIVIFFKTKNSTEPILGALFPIRLSEDPNQYPTHPMHLVFLQLPFAGDVRNLNMASFEHYFIANSTDDIKLIERKSIACDNLIDALRLPDGCIESGKVPSPFLRSWNQTKVKRAIDCTTDPVVNVRETTWYENALDPMATPPEILDRANNAMIEFQHLFPLSLRQNRGASVVGGGYNQKFKIKGGRKTLTYKDYLDRK